MEGANQPAAEPQDEGEKEGEEEASGEAAEEDPEEADKKGSLDAFMIPNRQESLFCCKRKGVSYLIVNTSQFMFVAVTLYFSYKLAGFFSDTGIGMGLGGLGIALSFYIWFWVMPELLDCFAISTSIEMMKNREAVNEVLMR